MSARTIDETPAPSGVRDVTTRASASTIRRALVAAGLFAIAAVHLAALPDTLAEMPYLGWAHLALIVASLVLAELVVTRSDRDLVTASAALSAGVLAGFVVDRTTGMPGARDDIGNWTEPLAMVSLLIGAAVKLARHTRVARPGLTADS